MISLTGILSLISALAATSYALSCIKCNSTTSTTCSGGRETCLSGYQCGSTYIETIMGGSNNTTFVRSCLPLSECDLKGSMTVTQGQSRSVSSCCSTDGCTPTISPLLTQSSDPNGVVCMSSSSTWCYTSDTMQCTGNETMCVLQTSKVTDPFSTSSAVRGCATKSVCDLGGLSKSINGISLEVKFICTSGGIGVHVAILTPPIVCLLLLKWFF